MSILQRTVSLILFGVGGLLALLGVTSIVMTPPEDATPEATAVVRAVFLAGGVVGIGLVALGVYLRTRRIAGGSVTMLWAGYAAFWVALLALTAFAGGEVMRAAADGGEAMTPVLVAVYLVAFLGAPVIELIARRRARGKTEGDVHGR